MEIIKLQPNRPSHIKFRGGVVALCVHDAYYLAGIKQYKQAIRSAYFGGASHTELIRIIKAYKSFKRYEEKWYAKFKLPPPPRRIAMENEKVTQIASKVSQILNIKEPDIRVVEAKRSYADLTNNKIELASWCLNNDTALTYNICHELLHLALDTQDHDLKFKIQELMLLKHFSMVPVYANAYADAILDGEGNILWER